MSVSTAIGQLSASLRNVLVGEMRLIPPVAVTILAPDEPGGDQRINLFLYKIEENSYLTNQEPTVKAGNPNWVVPAPLSLNLYYLLTSYARNDPQTGNATAHEILGEAMRVFYENSVIPEHYLENDLKGAREQFTVVYNALEPEELSLLWGTFGRPFRLSVRYRVSTVQLDVLPASEQPLPQRVRTIGIPGVQAPFQPPVVLEMTPVSGPVGATLTFTGEHLDGWQATLAIAGQTVLNKTPLTGNTFTATIPVGLQPAFYDIRLDISGLFRRTFLLEVIP
ncbi:MAG: DUF4255 domain-containing protein [Accumulibacter sp.]|uniref:DUF4255 domain-containing protein n=1 Tax=Accumulibacter sp. TaxID=2053492 RepID=UPI0033147C57